MSLYSLCSYFSVLCCCGCKNSIFSRCKDTNFFWISQIKIIYGRAQVSFGRGIRHDPHQQLLATECLQVWM